MSYVTVTWSVVAACALLLAIMYGAVWLMDRRERASLAFSLFAFSVVALVVTDLGMMRSTSAREWGEWVWWVHPPSFVLVVSLVVFVRLYFGAGRLWLMWTIIGLRAFVVIVNFASDVNFNFASIDSIGHIAFLGEPIAVVGSATVGRWQWVASLSLVLWMAYMADAALTLWRTGSPDSRRRAITIGSATVASALCVFVYVQLTIWKGVQLPALLTPPNLILLGAMAFEMSRDTLRAKRLTRELRRSEERLEFSAAAAGIGLWSWDVVADRVWTTRAAREMYGITNEGPLVGEDLRSLVDSEDLPRVRELFAEAAALGREAEAEFRIRRPDGTKRWLVCRGRSDADESGKVTLMRGVLRDITEYRRARNEISELRRDLAHAGRVSLLGTLSASLAHELSQPLAAIMTNAEVAEMLLRSPTPDLEELRQIVADIQRDDKHAGDVIGNLRLLLKRGELNLSAVDVAGLLNDVAALLRADAMSRKVSLACVCDTGIPAIRGDRVHLTQVLINIVINAMDAIADLPAARRIVTVRAQQPHPHSVEILVEDHGPGIPDAILPQVFEPFFTTKPTGTGMGLSVSRSIIDAHGGRLTAESGTAGGALFRLILPIA
jgi:two-component system, LuxR family, sensor kinase FixL